MTLVAISRFALGRAIDRLGALASLACAVHCAALPILLAALSLLGPAGDGHRLADGDTTAAPAVGGHDHDHHAHAHAHAQTHAHAHVHGGGGDLFDLYVAPLTIALGLVSGALALRSGRARRARRRVRFGIPALFAAAVAAVALARYGLAAPPAWLAPLAGFALAAAHLLRMRFASEGGSVCRAARRGHEGGCACGAGESAVEARAGVASRPVDLRGATLEVLPAPEARRGARSPRHASAEAPVVKLG